MTDEQVEKINEIIRECPYCIESMDVCRTIILPCSKAIDEGKCPEIIEYLKSEGCYDRF